MVMKILQLIFRIFLSPAVFLVSLGAMILFPGTFALLMGTMLMIGKLSGVEIDDDWWDIIVISTIIIWFPIVNTFKWVIEAKFLD